MKTTLLGVLIWALAIGASSVNAADGGKKQAGIGPSFKGPIGLQLYSLRDQFAKDVPGSLVKTRDLVSHWLSWREPITKLPNSSKHSLTQISSNPSQGISAMNNIATIWRTL